MDLNMVSKTIEDFWKIFAEEDRVPTITELANIEDLKNAMIVEREVKIKELEATPEYQEFIRAKEALEGLDLQSEIDDLAMYVEDARDVFQSLIMEYKNFQLEEYKKLGTKSYPGGGIQVRKKFVVKDPDTLLEKLIEKDLRSYLSVNEKQMGKDLNPDLAKVLGFDQLIAWEENIIATLAGDLSEFVVPPEDRAGAGE